MQHILITLGMILISFPIFSQKNELRDAERLVNRKNYTQARELLASIASNIDQAPDDLKSQYYYLDAISALQTRDTIVKNDKELDQIISSFNKVKEFELKTKSRKYTDKIEPAVGNLMSSLVNQAIELNNKQQYLSASRNFNQAYNLNPNDTLYLYYTASAALNGKDIDLAENRYKELLRLNYNGESTIYTALNLSNNQVESFGNDKKMRDFLVRQGSHSDPKMISESNKKFDIYKNLAFILLQKQNYSEAEDYLLEAFKINKNDETILLALMELYMKTNRLDMYEKFAKIAIETHPDRKVILYNLGLVAFQREAYDEAKQYFMKATKGKNASDNAYVMLANLALLEDATVTNKLNDMNQKSSSSAYQELFNTKMNMYREASAYLKEALKINKENIQAQNLLQEIEAFLNR